MKKSETSKFDFYEKVIVETKDPEKARIQGKLGAGETRSSFGEIN